MSIVLFSLKSITLLHDDDDNNEQYSVQSINNGYSVNSSTSFHSVSQESNLVQNPFQTATTIVISSMAQGTQTKLHAILLPQSPMSEWNDAKIEERTSMTVAAACQVNTLSYIIKKNEYQREVKHFKSDDPTKQHKDRLSTISRKMQNIKQHSISIDSLRYEYNTRPSDIDLKEELIAMSSRPLKCINACEAVDYNNNSEQMTCDQRSDLFITSNDDSMQKTFSSKLGSYRLFLRRRLRYRNKKCIHHFLQRLYYRKKLHRTQLSSFVASNNLTDIPPSYKAHEHTTIVRASENSTASTHFQTILNDNDSTIGQLIDLQVMLTSDNNYNSICILLDNDKQFEKDRSLFLRYIYKTLSNTLKTILQNQSIQMTCMNLVFFNNSICDLTKMQRIRLIDTGKNRLLQPSCEISLQTSDDIDIAINRFHTTRSFAHQIFIINFHHKQSSLSSSFLFLHLAPICSIRSTGLLTNLNSTTYSIMNLIRQLKNGHLNNHTFKKRYLLNDYSLNRLLKSYLFSSQQTMTVFTVQSNKKLF
ncbi:hypothetical protein I4U23_007725 [Adineta vaga]|nr:hypothetical protein I4U23_007725 [Adineta vaga]